MARSVLRACRRCLLVACRRCVRVGFQVPEQLKELLQRAAEASGQDLPQYVFDVPCVVFPVLFAMCVLLH